MYAHASVESVWHMLPKQAHGIASLLVVHLQELGYWISAATANYRFEEDGVPEVRMRSTPISSTLDAVRANRFLFSSIGFDQMMIY